MKAPAVPNPFNELADDIAQYMMNLDKELDEMVKAMPPFGHEEVKMPQMHRIWNSLTPEEQAALLPTMPPDMQRRLMRGVTNGAVHQ